MDDEHGRDDTAENDAEARRKRAAELHELDRNEPEGPPTPREFTEESAREERTREAAEPDERTDQ